VLVLNATFEPINVCSVRRAAVLLLKDKAEMLEHAAWELRSEHTAIPRPVVIRLVTFVKVPRDTHRRKITRRAGLRPRRLGLPVLRLALEPHGRPRHPALEGRPVELGEHRRLVRARATGARATTCPSRANMHPRRQPTAPSPHVFIHVASPTIPAAWRQWLPATGAVADAA
jgi:hypothetical protein